jgi:hypothetical protein
LGQRVRIMGDRHALAGWLATPGAAHASGFTITREVTTLEVRRTGHYTETVERTLRIDSPAGIDEHDQWSLTFNPERTERDRNNLFTARQSMVVVHPRVEVGSLLHVHWRATHAPIYAGHFAKRRALHPESLPEEWRLRLTHEPGMPVRAYHPGLVGSALSPDARGWPGLEFRVDKEEVARSEALRRANPEGPWVMLALSTYASWAEVARVCRSERHHEKMSLALPAGHVIGGGLPEGANFSQGALTYLSSYQVQREGDRTTLKVTREYIANCATRKLSRGDWKDLEALKVVVARDLRAQVGVR